MILRVLNTLNTIMESMFFDRRTLVELYNITLKELRHQERIYTQLVTGLFIIIPIFLTAISFLLGEDTPINPKYINYFKWSIFCLLIILFVFFWIFIFGIDRTFRICKNVIQKLETKLKQTSNPSEFEHLLIRSELEKKGFIVIYGKYRLWIYVSANIVALILIWFTLFQWMGT